ncbi:endonuclease [Prolixibacteraceae bacterium JC049]|nr:endonuclease [Prolixibacteraceae bacterium JC049]
MQRLLLVAALLFFIGCSHDEELKPGQIKPKGAQLQQSIAVPFRVLTYNVAGLPQIFSSAKNRKEYTKTIGRIISDYDIVNVQEDFSYHSYLYQYNTHTDRTSTSGNVPFGDGMNTLAYYHIHGFKRVDWDKCNGSDCLTPKGFTYAKLRLEEGVYIDVYNVHTNAGSGSKNYAARRANIEQLANFIEKYSKGNAVLVFGDTNCRYTRKDDNIRLLHSKLGLRDAWIDIVKRGNMPSFGSSLMCKDLSQVLTDSQCETVDKILYRGNQLIDLKATNCYYPDGQFRASNGDALSDHRPLAAEFVYQLSQYFRLSDQFGGPHGTPFNDINKLNRGMRPTELGIRCGKRLDQVNMKYSNNAYYKHGGNGGSSRKLKLQDGEYIKSVTLNRAKHKRHTRVFYAKFTTNKGRKLEGGSKTSSSKIYTAPDGWQIVGFHGRSGAEVDMLGVIYAPVY